MSHLFIYFGGFSPPYNHTSYSVPSVFVFAQGFHKKESAFNTKQQCNMILTMKICCGKCKDSKFVFSPASTFSPLIPQFYLQLSSLPHI